MSSCSPRRGGAVGGGRRCPGCGTVFAADNTALLCGRCHRNQNDQLDTPPRLSDEFFETDQFRAAFESEHIGKVFKAYRNHPRWLHLFGKALSQELLGHWLGLSQTQVSKLETLKPEQNLEALRQYALTLRLPSHLLWFKLPGQSRLEGALGASGELAGMAAGNGVISPDEVGRLAYVMAHPRRIDPAAVDSLAMVLAHQRRLEDAIGSAAMLGPALGQLNAVEQLVRQAHGPVRPALVEVAAQWAQFGGWLHAATGQYDAAARRFDQALGWAAETGDVQMTATALSFHGYLAERVGLPGPMVGVARAAMRDRGVYIGQRVYDAVLAARGHAMSGDRLDVAAALAEAGDLAAEFAEYHGPIPPWQYYRSPGFFVMERGLVHRILGREDRDANDRAVQDLTAGLAALPTEQRKAEWAAEYELQLARAFAQGGDQVSAQRVLDQVRVVAEATGSARLHAEAATLTRQLAR